MAKTKTPFKAKTVAFTATGVAAFEGKKAELKKQLAGITTAIIDTLGGKKAPKAKILELEETKPGLFRYSITGSYPFASVAENYDTQDMADSSQKNIVRFETEALADELEGLNNNFGMKGIKSPKVKVAVTE